MKRTPITYLFLVATVLFAPLILASSGGSNSSSGSGSSGITALTGDVTASGTGSVAATVNSIGGAAASTSGTASTIVKRDTSGGGAFGAPVTFTMPVSPANPGLTVDTTAVSGVNQNGIYVNDGRSSADNASSLKVANTRTNGTAMKGIELTVGGTANSSTYALGVYPTVNATNHTNSMGPLNDGNAIGNYGVYNYITSNTTDGSACGTANMAHDSKTVVGSINEGGTPKDVSGAQSYGVRAVASGLDGVVNTPQTVGIFAWITNGGSTLTSALENRNPGVSAAAVFSKSGGGGSIMVLQSDTANVFGVDSNGNVVTKRALAYSYQRVVALSGGSMTMANNTNTLVLAGGAISAYTVKLPTLPLDGQRVSIVTSGTITTLTVQANANQTLYGGGTYSNFSLGQAWVYVGADSAWYPE